MSELKLDVGQAVELKEAFRREGYTNEDIKTLCERRGLLADVRRVIYGHATVTAVEHVIDCDVAPFNPWEKDGFTVEEHLKGGQWKWDVSQVSLYRSKQQKGEKYIEGHKLREELKGKPVLNANVLDYLFANQHLIPEEWKEKTNGYTTYIFFWGTVYRYRDGYLFVRCLYWFGGRWRWSYNWLGYDWDVDNPAALRAS